MLTELELRKAHELLISNVRQRSKEKLKSAGRGIWTGKMVDAIDATIIEKDGDLAIEILGEYYQDFIDEGVNGKGYAQKQKGGIDRRFKSNRSVVTGSPYSFRDKKPPLNAINPWAKSKNINVFALQNSIYRKGIKPVHFFNSVLDSELEKWSDYLAEVMADSALNGLSDED